MRTDLDHLPAAKQRELDHAVQALFDDLIYAILGIGPRDTSLDFLEEYYPD